MVFNILIIMLLTPLPKDCPKCHQGDDPTVRFGPPVKRTIPKDRIFIPEDFKDHNMREGLGINKAIMLSVNHNMKELGEISMPNHKMYCDKHNIKYYVLRPEKDFVTSYPGAWGKLVGLRNALL